MNLQNPSENGRDPAGKFAPGHAGGPGRPSGRTAEEVEAELDRASRLLGKAIRRYHRGEIDLWDLQRVARRTWAVLASAERQYPQLREDFDG